MLLLGPDGTLALRLCLWLVFHVHGFAIKEGGAALQMSGATVIYPRLPYRKRGPRKSARSWGGGKRVGGRIDLCSGWRRTFPQAEPPPNERDWRRGCQVAGAGEGHSQHQEQLNQRQEGQVWFQGRVSGGLGAACEGASFPGGYASRG